MLKLDIGPYTFDIKPAVSVTKQPVDDYPGAPRAFRKTISIDGEILPSSPSAQTIADQRELLENVLKGGTGIGQGIIVRESPGNAIIDALWAQPSIGGIKIGRHSFSAARDGTDYATHLPIQIEASAEYLASVVNERGAFMAPPDAPDTNVYGRYTMEQDFQGAIRAVSIRGELQSPTRFAAEAEVDRIASAWASKNIIARSVTSAYTNPEGASPGASDGIDGWEDRRLVMYQFALQLIDKALSAEVVEYSEQIEITLSYQRVVPRILFDGPPILQAAGLTPGIIRQTGQAVGLTTWPTPQPRHPSLAAFYNFSPPRVTRSSPEVTADGTGRQRYKTTWTYEVIAPSVTTSSVFPSIPPLPPPIT